MDQPRNTTIVIKTFERPACVLRLIAQLRERYETVPIVVVDDSREPLFPAGIVPGTYKLEPHFTYCRTEFDIGISAGRNLGFSIADTKYVFLCDDDNTVIPETDLALAEQMLIASRLDMLGIREVNCEYYGIFDWHEDEKTAYYRTGERDRIGSDIRLYDFIPNLFIATKEAVTAFPWDPELKTGEHFAYFFTHRGKLRVGYMDKVSMGHAPETSDIYREHRSRADEYVKVFMRKAGVKRRIDLSGKTVEV